MTYTVTVYKYEVKGRPSCKHIFNYKSQGAVTKEEIEGMIKELLTKKIEFDSIEIMDLNSVSEEEYIMVEQGVGIAMDYFAQKANAKQAQS